MASTEGPEPPYEKLNKTGVPGGLERLPSAHMGSMEEQPREVSVAIIPAALQRVLTERSHARRKARMITAEKTTCVNPENLEKITE